MTDNKNFWQNIAKLYAFFMKGSERLYATVSNRIAPQISRQMNVLELACGSGQLSFRLASRAKLWEATDFSENMIAEAKKQKGSSRLHFSVQDATVLPYAPETFDAVVISNALHIMPQPEKALSEIRRVLKPGGLLFAPTFIHGMSIGFRLRSRILELVGFRVYSKWSEDEFSSFVSSNGFIVTEVETIGTSIAPLCYLAARREITISLCK